MEIRGSGQLCCPDVKAAGIQRQERSLKGKGGRNLTQEAGLNFKGSGEEGCWEGGEICETTRSFH